MKTIVVGFLFLITLQSCVKPVADAPVEKVAPDSSVGLERTDVLIYSGPGSWRAEVEALKMILFSHGATYETLSPDQINKLSLQDFSKYRAILFAGGDAPTVCRALTTESHARIREAVQKKGINYLGFCAGAWLAVAPAAKPGEDVVYGLGVVNAPLLKLNYLSLQGAHYALDNSIFPDGSQRKLLWYGGPVTLDLPGTVVAKYSDGTPAISQIKSGQGLVIMSGLHPAATKSILYYVGLYDREAIDPDFAWALLEAVITQKKLSTF